MKFGSRHRAGFVRRRVASRVCLAITALLPVSGMVGSLWPEWGLRAARSRQAWRDGSGARRSPLVTDLELPGLWRALSGYQEEPSAVVIALDDGGGSSAARQVRAQVAWILGPWPSPVMSRKPSLAELPECIVRPSRQGAWAFGVEHRYNDVVESASWTVYQSPR